MNDPKDVMRAYRKDEFPELTAALDGYPTEIPKGYVEVDMEKGPQFDLPDFSVLTEHQRELMDYMLSGKHTSHYRSGKSRIAQIVLLAALKERLKGDKPVVVVYMGPTPIPSWVEDLKTIEGVTVEVPGEQGKIVQDPFIVCDELTEAVREKLRQAGTFSRDFYDPEPMLEKKSKSTNPSDRWIKPKKLYRAKGKRK